MSNCSRRGVQQKFPTQTGAVLLLLLTACLATPAFGQAAPRPTDTPAQTLPPLSGASASNASETPGSAPLRVLVGKSLLINTNGDRIKRISVTDQNIADAIPVSPTQILVHGKSAGEVSLLIWDEVE
ncbi:MAG TPA: pilus assembly protein N-terminal domain-containing protein, partial [Terriglobales bacterium]|nr:pilus assembly protein N-terminal domain-containing protein [Terriglobales bacterium]